MAKNRPKNSPQDRGANPAPAGSAPAGTPAATGHAAAARPAASSHGHAGHGGHGGHAAAVDREAFHHHIVPIKTYVLVFLALMILLVATLWVATFDWGPMNLAIAMAVAIAKVVLIMTFFMHIKFGSTMVKLFSMSAFIWLFIMFLLTLADYSSRSWFPIK